MKKFLAIAAVTVGLSAAATTVANAQDYLVNGHAASKAEAQLLVSYGVQKGNWVVDGFGIASADSGQIRPATADERRAEVLVCPRRAALRVKLTRLPRCSTRC